MKKVLGLLYGGASGEHEVSIKSAFSILSNIDYEHFLVIPIFVDKENNWFEQGPFSTPPLSESDITKKDSGVYNPFSLSVDVDIVLPVTHGPFGEDGHIQAILEIANVPYVGCNLLSSAIGMDKAVMKDIFTAKNIPQGKYEYYFLNEYELSKDKILSEIVEKLGFPCFIKPSNLGSSVGISKANNREELITSLEKAFAFDDKVVVEEFIEAREIEIGVLGNGPYKLSALGEITTTSEFYDYEAKYVSTEQNQIIIPASLPNEIVKEVKDITSVVAKVINVKGLSRIDFFYDAAKERVLVNEINTLPGFTAHSMYPMLFEQIGIPYSELITELTNLALQNFKDKKRAK